MIVTQAKPQFRGGAMVLICDACAGGDVPDYDEVYVSIEADDDLYDDVEISIEADPDPAAPPEPIEGVIYGADDAAVSGVIE